MDPFNTPERVISELVAPGAPQRIHHNNYNLNPFYYFTLNQINPHELVTELFTPGTPPRNHHNNSNQVIELSADLSESSEDGSTHHKTLVFPEIDIECDYQYSCTLYEDQLYGEEEINFPYPNVTLFRGSNPEHHDDDSSLINLSEDEDEIFETQDPDLIEKNKDKSNKPHS